jgi:hypothetical protein
VCVGGPYQGTVDLGGGPLISAGDVDVFVGCFDAQGKAQWSERFGDAKMQLMTGLVVDGEGRLVLGGYMQGNIDLGGGPIGGPVLRSFIAQFTSDGAHVWSRLVSDGQTYLRGVGVDGLGAVLLTGNYNGANDFGGGVLVPLESGDAFLVKLDPDGAHVWSKGFAGTGEDVGYAVDGSTTGRVGMVGGFTGTLDPGDGPVVTKGGYDGFVGVFDP